MATLCRTFPTPKAARNAAEALRATGVPEPEIGLLVGCRRPRGHEQMKVTDDDTARELLAQARVPEDVARRMVGHLHAGEAVMFVQLDHVDLDTVRALICSEH